MYSATVDYYRAKSVVDAVKLLKKNPGAKLLAGGHSLIPSMKLRVAQPTALVDIGRIKGLSGIKATTKTLKIGALTTHNAVATSPEVMKNCAILAEAAGLIADQQVRNRGTIGGSLAQADPAADYPTLITALDATITVVGSKGERQIAAKDFFKDLFTTALTKNEVITTIVIPSYGKGTGGTYLKMKHPASGYAVVGVAALITIDKGKCTEVRLAVGGVTPNPVRVSKAEAALKGKAPDKANIESAIVSVAGSLGSPIGDIYASADYRKHLATVMSRRALKLAAERAMS
jgi:carbon-monoxide dehydrogenase medium subunit